MRSNPSRAIVFLFAFTVILLCAPACSDRKSDDLAKLDFKAVSVGNFSMDIPSIMKEAKSLNDEAALQYSNVFKEIYVVVIKEDKQNFIDEFMDVNEYDSTLSPVENYRAAQLKLLSEKMTIQKQGETKPLKINKLPAQQLQIDGAVEGVKFDIAYLFTFVEGKTDLYMVMGWTLKDRKEKYLPMFDKIARSFKETK